MQETSKWLFGLSSKNFKNMRANKGVIKFSLTLGLLFIQSSICNIFGYPPVPHHLLTGVVRDELGNPLAYESAEIIFESLSGVRIRSNITPGLKPGVNYEIKIPMDSGVTQDIYKPTAMFPAAPFRILVVIDGIVHLPIEMQGDFSRVGQPSETSRLDLTLGEDLDGDGLPDAWERALASKTNGDLSSVGPNDDFDGDGLSNLDEYISGNYAFDADDGFELKIIGNGDVGPLLEFMAITARTYEIVGSADMNHWDPIEFRIKNSSSDNGQNLKAYYAEEVSEISVEVILPESVPAQRFYKLLVH